MSESFVKVVIHEKKDKKFEVIKFDGEDAFLQLYKYIAKKYGFNGKDLGDDVNG
jgi:hypothetical protein